MKTMKIPVLALFAITLFVLIAGCTQPAGTPGPVSQTNVGILYSKGVGPMPMLLATKQIDGYIAWQPFVSIGTESGIARLVEYSGRVCHRLEATLITPAVFSLPAMISLHRTPTWSPQ